MLVELSVVEQRLLTVMEVVRDGAAVSEVAGRYGVSRQSVHNWLRRYATGGLDGLRDRSHRPHGCPHQMPAAVGARLVELRRSFPEWGPVRLAHQLATEGVDPLPGRTSIYRALVRNQLVTAQRGGGAAATTGAGSASGRWSCGSWTSWAGSCWLMGRS